MGAFAYGRMDGRAVSGFPKVRKGREKDAGSVNTDLQTGFLFFWANEIRSWGPGSEFASDSSSGPHSSPSPPHYSNIKEDWLTGSLSGLKDALQPDSIVIRKIWFEFP